MPTRSELTAVVASVLVIVSAVAAGGLGPSLVGTAAGSLSGSTPTAAVTTAAVSGTVTAQGTPVDDDRIVFAPPDGRTPTTALTSTDGTYQASIPTNTPLIAGYLQGNESESDRFENDGLADVHASEVMNVSESAVTKSMSVPVGHDVSVTVENPQGEPLGNASVRLADFVPGTDAYLYADRTTGADGTLPGVVEMNGTVAIAVDPEGTTYDETTTTKVTVDRESTFTIEVPEAGLARASVEDASGQAVTDATVVWQSPELPSGTERSTLDTTGKTETVTLRDGVTYGTVVLQGNHTRAGDEKVTAPDGRPDVYELGAVTASSSSDTTSAYTLPSATMVDVQVLDKNDEPVVGAAVEVSPEGSGAGLDGTTNASGYVVLDGRSTAGVELAADAELDVDPGSERALPEKRLDIDVDTSAASQTTSVYLVEETELRGSLYRGLETPVDAGVVVAERTSDGRFTSGEPVNGGSYTVTPWRNVEQDVLYLANGSNADANRDGLPDLYVLGRSPLDGTAFSSGPVTLPDGHVVTLTVVDESGEPVEDASVAVTHETTDGLLSVSGTTVTAGNVTAVARTDTDGELNVSNFGQSGLELAGDVTFEVEPPDGESRFVDDAYTVERTVTASSNDTVTVTLDEVDSSTPTPTDPTPTPTDTPTPTPTDTPTPTPTDTPTDDDDDDASFAGGGSTPTPEPTATPSVESSPSLSVVDAVGFGRIRVGSTAERTVTLENDGTAPLRVDELSLSGPEEFSLGEASLEDGGTVGPGEDTTMTVSFAPDLAGIYDGSLTVEHNASGPTDVELSGTGIESSLSVEPTSVGFGSVRVGENVTRTLTVTNDGTAPATLSTLSVTNATGVDVDGPTNTTVAPGASRNVTLRYAPASTGTLAGTLTVGDGDTALSVSLSGEATAPDIEVSRTAVGFEDAVVGEESTQTLELENDGSAPLTVTAVALTGSDAASFSVDAQNVTLPAGQSDDLAVTFAPEETGNYSATLQVFTNDPDEPRADVWLSNTETVVQSQAQTANNTTQVNVSVENPVPGQPVEINTSTAESVDGDVAIDSLAVESETAESYTLNVSSSEQPTVTRNSFNLSDGTLGLGYLNVEHTVPDEEIDGVEFEFRVSKSKLQSSGTDPDEVVLHRFNEGQWSKLPTSIARETSDHYILRAQSPGLSDFVVGGEQAKFELLQALVDVTRLTVGDEMAVRVRITNVGGADGAFTAQLLLNEQVVQERDITIAANGTRQATFERELGAPGQYAVRVNDERAGNVTVQLPRNDTQNASVSATVTGGDTGTTGDATTDDTTAFGFPGFGPVVALVALLVAALLMARRPEP